MSAALNEARKQQAGEVARVSAPPLEWAVIKILTEAYSGSAATAADEPTDTPNALVEQHLERVTVHKDRLEISVWDSAASTSQTIAVPWSASSPARKRQILLPQSATYTAQQPIRWESRARLLEAIARGRYWLNQLTSGEVRDTQEIAKREGCSDRSVRMTVSLAFVSPPLAKATIEGALRRGMGMMALVDLPADWEIQRRITF